MNSNEVALHCSDCGRGLMIVMVVNPRADFTARYRCRCCFCGDASWPVEIKGTVAPAGYHLPKPDDVNDCVPVTQLLPDTECDGDTFTFSVEKA